MYFGISCFCVINSCKDRILQDFVKGGGGWGCVVVEADSPCRRRVSSYNPPPQQ